MTADEVGRRMSGHEFDLWGVYDSIRALEQRSAKR